MSYYRAPLNPQLYRSMSGLSGAAAHGVKLADGKPAFSPDEAREAIAYNNRARNKIYKFAPTTFDDGTKRFRANAFAWVYSDDFWAANIAYFQKKHGMKVDGKLGPQTAAKMVSELKKFNITPNSPDPTQDEVGADTCAAVIWAQAMVDSEQWEQDPETASVAYPKGKGRGSLGTWVQSKEDVRLNDNAHCYHDTTGRSIRRAGDGLPGSGGPVSDAMYYAGLHNFKGLQKVPRRLGDKDPVDLDPVPPLTAGGGGDFASLAYVAVGLGLGWYAFRLWKKRK